MNKILVVVKGGAVQSVFATGRCHVHILDYDDLGCNDNYLEEEDKFRFPDYNFPGGKAGDGKSWNLSDYFQCAYEIGAPTKLKLSGEDEKIYNKLKECGL